MMVPENEISAPVVSPLVSVIVPARNEEACLERCLRSLVSQQGVPFELIVVNDGSMDRTAEIAENFAHINDCPAIPPNSYLVSAEAIDARPLPSGWTGKANAVFTGALRAHGEWLLFTDADTEHRPNSLARAVAEARSQGADVLSYSPEQEVHGLAERALMPVIFSDLAMTYKPAEVSDSSCTAAAANGQYLLISRETYDAVGGHASVAGDLLEDVALARVVKRSGRKLFFRFGGDQVRARMYRGWQQLREGWTKNLALLFANPERLALKRLVEFAVMALTPMLAAFAYLSGRGTLAVVAGLVAAVAIANFYLRIRRAHFDALSTLLAFFGGPLFAYVLLSSVESRRANLVWWKGRSYPATVTDGAVGESIDKDVAAARRD